MILTSGLQRYAAHCSQALHRHDTTSVTLLLRGQLRERSGGIEVAADPLSLVIKPADTLHANVFGGSPVVTCQIVLDPDAHDGWRWKRALARWRWIVGGPAVAAATALAHALVRDRHLEPEIHREMAEAVLDALEVDGEPSAPPGWLNRAIEYLEDELAKGARRIRVGDAAAAAGVHAVHLSRVFQREFGVPVVVWVRRRRIQRAAHALALSTASLSSVAAACGFADHSHMTRAFRRDAGMVPARYRRLIETLGDRDPSPY